MTARTTVRPPAVAGMFYPGEPHTLGRQIDELLTRAQQADVAGEIVALISPHAGYMYSGFTAAKAYTLLQGKNYDSVVIVSPSHREYFDGISVYDGDAYRTPLGEVPVDGDLRAAAVQGEKVIILSEIGHRQEHAVEVQLPFLQRVLGKIKVLPIVVGDQRREYCFHLGKKLAKILAGRRVLIIASTDLSHYYPYDTAVTLDQVIVGDVERFDYEQLMIDLETERAEACGGGPTVAVLLAAHELGANVIRILHVCNSGDVTGDRSGVVGYLSAAILRTS